MKSRYQVLRMIGTLAIILAWILLIVGVAAAIAGWATVNGLSQTTDLPGGLALLAIVPGLLFAISNFLQFFVLGKVLHLLVGLDDTSANMAHDLKRQVAAQQP